MQEVYVNPALVLVACEIRLVDGSLRIDDEMVDTVSAALHGAVPVLKVGQRQNLVVGPTGPSPIGTARILQLTTRDQDLVVELAPDAVIVKSSAYGGWGVFRPLLEQVINAVVDAGGPDSFIRAGLRYIDEIRQPDNGGNGWDRYLHPRLLAAGQLADDQTDLTPTSWQTTTRTTAGSGHQVVIRHGPGTGYAVDPTQLPLREERAPNGDFFLFDIDSYWEAERSIPEFDRTDLLTLLDRLHAPIRDLFESNITDAFRDDVLRREPHQ